MLTYSRFLRCVESDTPINSTFLKAQRYFLISVGLSDCPVDFIVHGPFKLNFQNMLVLYFLQGQKMQREHINPEV